MRRYIRHCFIGYLNTSNFVKNTPLRVLFQVSSRCLDIPMKHCFLCLIYYTKNTHSTADWFAQRATDLNCCKKHSVCPPNGNITRNAHSYENGRFDKILLTILWNLTKFVNLWTFWRKWRIWWSFAKVVGRIIPGNRCDLARGAPKSRRIWPAKVTVLISGHRWQNGLFYGPCYLFTHISNFAIVTVWIF